jgi:hypothetical protein
MIFSILFHPISAFIAGLLVAIAAIVAFLGYHAAPNESAADLLVYRDRMSKVAPSHFQPGGPGEVAALKRFTDFLKKIGDPSYIREETLHVYAADAYLDDTLVVHHGAAEIESYFLKTSETMTGYELVIDDVARSGEDYYIRWSMTFSAPALSGGKPVHSVGMSQIRFNREGKVGLHRDFWDSGRNFFGHLPGAGGVIGFIRKKLESSSEKN